MNIYNIPNFAYSEYRIWDRTNHKWIFDSEENFMINQTSKEGIFNVYGQEYRRALEVDENYAKEIEENWIPVELGISEHVVNVFYTDTIVTKGKEKYKQDKEFQEFQEYLRLKAKYEPL